MSANNAPVLSPTPNPLDADLTDAERERAEELRSRLRARNEAAAESRWQELRARATNNPFYFISCVISFGSMMILAFLLMQWLMDNTSKRASLFALLAIGGVFLGFIGVYFTFRYHYNQMQQQDSSPPGPETRTRPGGYVGVQDDEEAGSA
eukprot:gnl/Spiro4/12094_TR6381_c0_g1_i1.p1 gnl/Spiro4/12094_TR6381_c0_g1~~gnl/Spiro4/12094_TR6381_c0_g1_i1.p1  ORF type:complete len:151 (+),score=22.70 gnl/Spiro4/12094_TR6381_c0_g1_i1:94-546(+)